jgi:hypothetical protein
MIAALRAAETKTERSGGAGRKGGWGEACLPAGREFLPALACPSEAERRRRAFPPPNFVFRFAKNAARKGVTLAPALPCAGNNKELPKIWLLKIILFGSIKIQIITLYTIILPKLYLYDKWKNNQ